MGTTDRGSDPTATGRFDPVPWFRWVAVTTAILVMVQALLAGRGWFVDVGLIEVHGWVGNATFLVAVTQWGVAFLAWRRRVVGRTELVLSGLLVLLIVAQLGLGYAGRESAGAAAWHVPNGVLIFGATAALLTRAFSAGTTSRRPDAKA